MFWNGASAVYHKLASSVAGRVVQARTNAFRLFADSSIRTKLSLLILLTSSFALILAGLGLFGYQRHQEREAAVRELSAQAGIIAENSTAALSFNDEQSATTMLQALRWDSQVADAVIYDSGGQSFARYTAVGVTPASAIPHLRQAGVYFEDGALLVFQAIRLRGEQIGTIFLKSHMDGVYHRLHNYIGMVCLVLLVALGAASLLSASMQRTVTGPLGELSGVARRISIEKNYSVRAIKHTNDEVGSLIDSFNQMLSQIEIRELARIVAEKALRESEERYALAARGANDGLWDWKLTTNEVYFSSRWGQMLGYQDNEIGSSPDQWLERIHPSDRERVTSQIVAHCEGRTAELVSEYRMQCKNGAFVWMLSRGIAIKDTDGKAIRMAGSQTDITEGKVADPLTGLPNRLYLIDKLETAIEGSVKENRLCAVLFLDLDRFKLVNDTLGHAAGDDLLIEVAGRLRSAVRGGDSVRKGLGYSATVARLGGDEFVVLLNDIHEQADAVTVAERILKYLASSVYLEGRQVFASGSIGIAFSTSADTPEDLLQNADTAMYHAKTLGKGRIEVFDESMRERLVARAEIETGLRRAIGAGELILHYQAQVSTSILRVTGYEALVRWNHPRRGLLSPTEFIPIAEESDLILQIGRWVLKEACRQMAEWHRQLTSAPMPTISVNISAKELSETGFVERVQRVLEETGLNPASLKLEVTEGSVMGNPENAVNTLNRLKRLNIGLEIDDFGTGYSSLSYLQRLPFDTVKIDRSFVRELGKDAESTELVRTILKLALSLGMTVVAEGVETEDQVQRLRRLGCNQVQGFYFSKPIAPPAAMALMLETDEMQLALHTLQGAIPPSTLENVEGLHCPEGANEIGSPEHVGVSS